VRPSLAALLGALTLLSAAGPVAAQAAARTPVQLGAAINDQGFQWSDRDPRYLATLAANYQAAIPESATKISELLPDPGPADPLAPTAGDYHFGLADQMVDFAQAHGMQMDGGPLIWCDDPFMPAWMLQRSWTAGQLEAVMDDYITRTMQHFGARVASWQVVNEAWNPDGTLRDCLWLRVLGPGYIEHAFKVAHDAEPGAQLFYNEYRADWVNSEFLAMEKMARGLIDDGVPLAGIGLQMHLYGRAPPQYRLEQAMARVAALGLRVRVTELEDALTAFSGTTDDRLAAQAQAYQTVAAACQAEPRCDRLVTWGFTDAYSRSGPTAASLPFDANYQPKPAWQALQRVLRTPAPAPGNHKPQTAGAPSVSAAISRGLLTVSWPAAYDADGDALTYALQHRDANDTGWATIASGIRGLSYTFSQTWPEQQGTWKYQVIASDAATDSPPSAPSAPAVVDRTPPLPPVLTPDRPPDTGGGWYRDSVTFAFASAGDPPLPDGSPGAGVDPTTLPGPQTLTADGLQTATGTVSDLAGNVSDPGSASALVDAAPPTVTLSAGAGGLPYAAGTWTNKVVTVHATCTDDGTGVASTDPDAVVDDEGAGQTRTLGCRDLFGHAASAVFGPVDIDRTPPVAPSRTVTAFAEEPVTLDARAKDPPGGSGVDPASITWSRRGTPHKTGARVRFTFATPGTRELRLRFRDRAGNLGAAVVTVVVGGARTVLRAGAVEVAVPHRAARRLLVLSVSARATRTLRAELRRRGGGPVLAAAATRTAPGGPRTLRLHLPAGVAPGPYAVWVSVLRGPRRIGRVLSAPVTLR